MLPRNGITQSPFSFNVFWITFIINVAPTDKSRVNTSCSNFNTHPSTLAQHQTIPTFRGVLADPLKAWVQDGVVAVPNSIVAILPAETYWVRSPMSAAYQWVTLNKML